MGKKIRKQAEQLDFTKNHMTILYARPRHLRHTSFRGVPDVADEIYLYIKSIDPTVIQEKSGNPRNTTYYYLAFQTGLYVEVTDKAAGFNMYSADNHAIQIIIYSNNNEHILGIAHKVNQLFKNGILEHINWKKIEKKYKIKKEECITAWNDILKVVEIEIPHKIVDKSKIIQELQALKIKLYELPKQYPVTGVVFGSGVGKAQEQIPIICQNIDDAIRALNTGLDRYNNPISIPQIANGIKHLINAVSDPKFITLMTAVLNSNGIRVFDNYLNELEQIANAIS